MWRANAPLLKKHLPHSLHTPPVTAADDERLRFMGTDKDAGNGRGDALGGTEGNNGSDSEGVDTAEDTPGNVGLTFGAEATDAIVVVGDDMGKNLSNMALARSIVGDGTTWRCGSEGWDMGCDGGGAECGKAMLAFKLRLQLPWPFLVLAVS